MADDLRPYPWHVTGRCKELERGGKPCGGPLCLEPFNPSGWYGPRDATLFCQACGTGCYGTDAEIELALIAECWWDAFNRGDMTEADFAEAHRG